MTTSYMQPVACNFRLAPRNLGAATTLHFDLSLLQDYNDDDDDDGDERSRRFSNLIYYLSNIRLSVHPSVLLSIRLSINPLSMYI